MLACPADAPTATPLQHLQASPLHLHSSCAILYARGQLPILKSSICVTCTAMMKTCKRFRAVRAVTDHDSTTLDEMMHHPCGWHHRATAELECLIKIHLWPR
jgi:hypothetical protein